MKEPKYKVGEEVFIAYKTSLADMYQVVKSRVKRISFDGNRWMYSVWVEDNMDEMKVYGDWESAKNEGLRLNKQRYERNIEYLNDIKDVRNEIR